MMGGSWSVVGDEWSLLIGYSGGWWVKSGYCSLKVFVPSVMYVSIVLVVGGFKVLLVGLWWVLCVGGWLVESGGLRVDIEDIVLMVWRAVGVTYW